MSPQPLLPGPAAAATVLSIGGVAVVTAAGVLVPDLVRASGPALLAAGVLLGLPHGAVDHLAPAWAAGRPATRPQLRLLVGYASAATLTLAFLLAAPLPGVLALLVVSAVHFGIGELTFAAERAGRRWRPGRFDLVAVVGLGGLPVAVPLARWQADTDPILAALAPGLPALLAPWLRVALAAVVGGCLAVTVAGALRARRGLVAVEGGLLAGLFLATPPLAAFAAYFGGWHALRHLARLLCLDPRNASDLAAGKLAAPLRRYLRAAALPTLVALTGIVLLAAAATRPQFAAPALAVLLSLSVPHVAVVAVLDRHRASRVPSTASTPGRGVASVRSAPG